MSPAHEGIEVRHREECRSLTGGRCHCQPSYRAHVWLKRERKLVRRTFPTLAAAKAWRHDAQVALRRGTLRAPARQRLDQAAGAFLAGARDGSIRSRSGDRYKPSAIRGYEQALRLRVLPKLGGFQVSELRRTDVQDFADGLMATSLSPSTIRNTLLPLRAIYRRAITRGEVTVNPTHGVELPAVRGRRERIASAEEAAALIQALPAEERALWGTAFYAGLRLGELQALRWDDVDLAAGLIHVRRSWDPRAGAIEPKSRAGRRTVPVPGALRDHLVEHRIADPGRGLVFGRSADRPFNPTTIYARAERAWKKAGLDSITPHEGRHTFASLMIAAGVNAKALSTYLGHSSIQITFDRYGHLMPGNEAAAVSLMDAYLERTTRAGDTGTQMAGHP